MSTTKTKTTTMDEERERVPHGVRWLPELYRSALPPELIERMAAESDASASAKDNALKIERRVAKHHQNVADAVRAGEEPPERPDPAEAVAQRTKYAMHSRAYEDLCHEAVKLLREGRGRQEAKAVAAEDRKAAEKARAVFEKADTRARIAEWRVEWLDQLAASPHRMKSKLRDSAESPPGDPTARAMLAYAESLKHPLSSSGFPPGDPLAMPLDEQKALAAERKARKQL